MDRLFTVLLSSFWLCSCQTLPPEPMSEVETSSPAVTVSSQPELSQSDISETEFPIRLTAGIEGEIPPLPAPGSSEDVIQNNSGEEAAAVQTVQQGQVATRVVPSSAVGVSGFVAQAMDANSRLQQLRQQYQAALAKVELSDELPDPMLGTNIFGNPIETAAGSQRANFNFSQKLPWFRRLNAQEQQAIFEAFALAQVIQTEEWKVRAEVKRFYYRLQLVERQIAINKETTVLLKSLVDLANQRVAVGGATAGDVLLGTVTLAEVERELVELNQQRNSTRARLNAVLNQPADAVVVVETLEEVTLPVIGFSELRMLTLTSQPEIEAARLLAQASSWGVQVARLQRVPDVTLGASWFVMDDNRPATNVVDVGEDAWSVGIMVNVPLWERKNQAREYKAQWEEMARRSEVETLTRKYDSLLADLWEQAVAADETITLYEKTLIPQTTKTLEADQLNYAQGNVSYDRVVEDVRMLLKFQVALARERSRLSTVIAGLEQVSAQELQQPIRLPDAQEHNEVEETNELPE